MQAIRSVPFQRLNAAAGKKLHGVVDNPSFYRQMPTQQIDCDAQMFNFLVRRPEVMVNIWEIMGITKVSARRLNEYSFLANDGVGTDCRCDLLYGDKSMHIYYGDGIYDGSMTPRRVSGRCVCILRSHTAVGPQGQPIVRGTMDIFLKLDNFGADLLTRTIGPFVGKTADQNFVETAKFISQISTVCKRSPLAAQGLALRLDRVDEQVRRDFATLAARISANGNRSSVPPATNRLTDSRESLHVPLAPPKESRPRESQPQVKVAQPGSWRAQTTTASRDGHSGDRPAAQETAAPGFSSLRFSDLSSTQSDANGPPSTVGPLKPNIYMRR